MVYKLEKIKLFWLTGICHLSILSILASCETNKDGKKDEGFRVDNTEAIYTNDTTLNSIQGNTSLTQVASTPNSIILTGMPNHRLVTVYKAKEEDVKKGKIFGKSGYTSDYGGVEYEGEDHFMPGIDILYGYKLLNLAHYDITTEKLNFLFDHPTLIKTLYYPSFIPDSINKKPINRDYFLVSAYDADTNLDTLINREDLRKFYHFDASCYIKTQLIPDDYSVMRSQYDAQNDIMYIFARHDENKNGSGDQTEPIHVFWIDLKGPLKAKRLY